MTEEQLKYFIEQAENLRIIINPLTEVNLSQQLVRLGTNQEKPLNPEIYNLDEIPAKLLYWAGKGLTAAEIAGKLDCSINDTAGICDILSEKNIIRVARISENELLSQTHDPGLIPYSGQNFRAIWQKAVGEYPENILIYGEEGSELTYRESNVITANITRNLQASGLKKGDRAIFYSRANTEEVLTIWACMQLGLVIVPVDHHTPEPDLRHIVSTGNIKFAFVNNRTYGMARNVFEAIPIVVFDEENKIPLDNKDCYFSDWCIPGTPEATGDLSHNDEAVLLYIPGQTGKPPIGISFSQGNLVRTGKISSDINQWQQSDRYFVLACMKTIIGFRNCCFTPLFTGASIILPADNIFRNPMVNIPEAIFKSKSTILLTNPALFKSLLILKNRNGVSWDCLRIALMMSTENIGAQLKKDIDTAFSIKINNYFGFTETTGLFITDTEEGENQEVSGRPCGGIAQVVDEKDQIVPVGQPGKLRIYSENIIKEFTEPPKTIGFFDYIRDGWLYTGDTVKYNDNGRLIFYVDGK
jgi:acyl-coenzyme A synthetase/AMP-(fatty) acid ligase